LKKIPSESINLILTDPPYQISKKTNFSTGSLKNNYTDRFRLVMDFGHWDKKETNGINFINLCDEFYRVLKKGGTCIIFWDLWKIQDLANVLSLSGFKQLRFIEWIKINPVPINSQINYLTNAREIAICAVKGGGATFNSKYDKGIYEFPIEHSSERCHPTQKSLKLFESLILKHSNVGDKVLDVFCGSGTTIVASKKLKRIGMGCENNQKYFVDMMKRLEKYR
jgi:DNA modification methylase